MTAPDLLTFPSDVPFRRQLQPPGARRHPGKLHLGFLAYLLTAHAPRGGRLLDPFAGSGGLLLATLPPWGCHVLLNELEPQWVAQCQAAWAYLQASPAAPRGTAQIVQGDARALRAGGWDGLITSPPYGDVLAAAPGKDRHPERVQDRRSSMATVSAQYMGGYDAVAPGPFHRIRAKSRPDALIIDREGALVLEVPPCP